MDTKTFTTFDIAKILDVYPTTVANWIDNGKIKFFITPGGHRRVNSKNLLQFLKKYNMPIPKELKLSDKERILVVEDDPMVLKSIVKILKVKNKYEISIAADGFEAGKKFSEVSPDVIILDIMLPGINGFKVCELIRKEDKNVKIIAITGYDTEENKEKILSAGADIYLPKPFEMGELIMTVEKLLK